MKLHPMAAPATGPSNSVSDDHAQILQQTLNEEKHADKLLTEISHTANATAAV